MKSAIKKFEAISQYLSMQQKTTIISNLLDYLDADSLDIIERKAHNRLINKIIEKVFDNYDRQDN